MITPNVWVTISTQELKPKLQPKTYLQLKVPLKAKAIGQLVVLGFDVTVFTPAPYQRHRL